MARRATAILSFLGIMFSLAAWCGSYFNFFYNTQPFSGWRRAKLNISVQLKQGTIAVSHGTFQLIRLRSVQPGNMFSLRELNEKWGFYGYIDAETVFMPKCKWGATRQQIALPLWMPLLVFGGTYFWSSWLPVIRRRRRARAGLCVNCGFDLRESSAGCSECGYGRPDFQPQRFNRRGLIVSGAMLVLIVVIAAAGFRLSGWVYRTVDYPLSNVLADAEDGSDEAFRELRRRVDAGVLSVSESRRVAEDALLYFLSEIEADAHSITQWALVLDRLDIAGGLSASQQVQFYRHIIIRHTVLAETHVAGEPISLGVTYELRGVRSLWAEVTSPTQMRLDGIVLKNQAEGVYSSNSGGPHTLELRGSLGQAWSMLLNNDPLTGKLLESRGHEPTHHFCWLGVEPGRHLLEIDEVHRLFRGNPDHPEPSPPIWSQQITYTVEFDILP